MNGLVVLLWSAAIALVLIVCGIFVTLVMMDRISLFGGEERPATSQQTPGAIARLDTSYRVLIINATPEKGLVDDVRAELLTAGWSSDHVFGSDGSSQEFSKTTVFYVDEADRDAALGLAELLGDVDAQQSDFYAGLNDSDEPQLTVVIGLDRAASGAPSSEQPDSTPAP